MTTRKTVFSKPPTEITHAGNKRFIPAPRTNPQGAFWGVWVGEGESVSWTMDPHTGHVTGYTVTRSKLSVSDK